MTDSITVTVNGKARRVTANASLRDLLQQVDLDPRAVVVELNRAIVRRPELEVTRLGEGDQVEIVHFVGGG
ncbi:MAG: sulfur carrier protein ThiS [Gemmatimonadota bacterium]|nr:sulfur carrier protein ThiS [Gemmatimonadota bacterium]MDH3367066.1 sulfur carrier protein ThiS [Gemmatimonadota bacterium]MDH3478506.1 sulfur carrier protein ThiS [Gemmatimonadota bacterium]MDH5548409.1 sulfur carrier protein ThiS [Gemmatimonadota bacterium]